jgi:hypothetical protein
MMSEKILTCVCGAQFNNSQKFNSHKSHCKEHYLHKYGSLTEYEAHKTAKNKAVGKALHLKAETEKQLKLDSWIAEGHNCERCGEVMTVKFGSGRFCSRACANAREHSDETKAKISKSLIKPAELKKKKIHTTEEPKSKILKVKSLPEPKVCSVCGVTIGKHSETGLCSKHLTEHKQQLKLQHWLKTGDIGMSPDTTIRGIFRDYIMEQQNHCCAICGIQNEWSGKPLVFVLDHINGDAARSDRDNLRLICPNCDSQLDTYKSKNKNSARTKRKEFLRDIREEDK